MAAELGISFDQVGGGLAFLTRASGDAAMSATQLGGVMKSFLKPSQQAKKVLEEIGVDLHELRAAASADLLGALQGLREQLEANGFEMSNVFEDIRGLNGALQLTGVATGAAREVFDELANSTGKLDEAFLGVQKTAQFKLSQAMAGMKASMITLGEQVLPVIIPMVAALAGWIGSLATAFGNMEGPAQKAVVIFGIAAAAVGPLLMVLGSLTTALSTLSIAAGGAAVTLGAVLIPIGLIVAAGVGLFAFFSKMGERSKEAQDRANDLTEAMIAQGDNAPLLGTELDKLIEKYNLLTAEVGETTEKVVEFAGESVLAGLALDAGVSKIVDDLQSEFPSLNAAIATGTTAFSEWGGGLAAHIGTTTAYTTALRGADPAIREVTSAIADQIDAGKMSRAEAAKVMRVLGLTATAYRDSAAGTMESNRAIIENTENTHQWADILGGPAVQAVLNLAQRTGDYNTALATINRMLDFHTTKLEKATTEAEALEAAQKGIGQQFAYSTAEIGTYLDAVRQAGYGTEAAMEQSSDALARNLRHWREQREAVEEAREAQQEFNSAFMDERFKASQASFRNLSGIMDDFARKAEDEAREERERIAKAARERRVAASAQIRAERRLESVTRDRLRLVEDIKDTQRDLNRLTDQRADVESDSGDWAIRYKRDLASAALSVMSITDRIRELQATEQATSGVPAAKDAVAHLVDVASAVNTVEQALIDMGVITVTQARIADMSAQDAKALVDLNKRLKQTEKEMAEGEATQLDLWAAMEDYTEAVEDATRESGDLRRARENLSRAESDAIQLEKEQERVIHELEVAYVDLAEAERTRAGLMDKEATRSATLAEIEEQRAELQRTLEDQNRQLLESGLDLMEAQAGLADAEAEVARTGADVNGVLDEQARLFESVDTEAGELGGTLGSLADFMYEIVTAAGKVEKAFIGMSQAAALKALETGVGIPSLESQIAGARAAGVQPGTYTEFTGSGAQTAAELDAWFASMGIDGAASGGFVKSGGLLNVHAGETIVPAGRGGGVSVVVNVEGSVTSERELVETIRRGLLRAQQSGKAVVL
jgi:hypothetical protein